MARPLPHCRLVYNDLTHSHTGPPALFSHYDKVFGAMYGQIFDLDSSNATIEELLQDVVGIIDVSKYLGCMHAIAHTINSALLGQGQVLWRSVQANPFAWVDLALRVRSTAIFAEAIIHLVGRWNSFDNEQIAGLDPVVRKLCLEKHGELQYRCIQTECRVTKYYPKEITRPIGAPPKHIQRMSYANDIYTWMALNIFRHWFTSVTVVGQNYRAEDGGYWFYQCLSKGGNLYLAKNEVNKFHEKFPMSTRGEHVLDQTVNRIKEMIRPLVADIVRSEANLDQDRYPVNYLTCTIIRKEEVQALMDSMDGGKQATIDWGQADQPKAGEKRKQRAEMHGRDLNQQLWVTEPGFEDPEMIVAKRPKHSNGVEEEIDCDDEDEIDDDDDMEVAHGSASELEEDAEGEIEEGEH